MKITRVAAAVILRADGSFLLGRRAPGTYYPGYWEFPGGKVEAGETPHDALVRELAEELGIEVIAATPWIVREHVYEHAHVRLHFFRVTQWRGEIVDHVHDALAWQTPGAETVAPMLPANAPVLAALTLPGVYGITHAWQIGLAAQLAALDAALAHGLKLVQLREVALPEMQREAFAAAAVSRCRQYGARVLVNGDAQLARAIGADGLHLPARQLLVLDRRPPFPLVAASCHERHELEHAARLGLDFAVAGPVLPTASHPHDAGIGWERFAALIRDLPLPVYAIGGLSPADLPAALAAGAQGIAAIRAAWRPDPAR
ncbi:Nudix family hydrolase [Sulfuricystis thermophila]|uniref:Nudix family hydrolase n=1 Tax=Sulfuricystis thermophila TaxID=2496847 RepID=UPI0024DFE11F|nr:Nudix family hydrolase [Sulfuricystis thermophila]